MKMLLLSQNPVVNKLVTLSAQKTGDELVVAAGLADVPEGNIDLLIVDEGVYEPFLMEGIEEKATVHSALYMGAQSTPVPEGFDRSLNKPFLPTDLLKLMSEVEEMLNFTVLDESVAEAEAPELEELAFDTDEAMTDELEFTLDDRADAFDDLDDFDDLDVLDTLDDELPETEEEEEGSVLDAEELQEVQHLLEETETPEAETAPDSFEEEAPLVGLNSNTLDEVKAVLGDLEEESAAEVTPLDEEEAFDFDMVEALEDTAVLEDFDFDAEEPTVVETAPSVETEPLEDEGDMFAEATAEEEPETADLAAWEPDELEPDMGELEEAATQAAEVSPDDLPAVEEAEERWESESFGELVTEDENVLLDEADFGDIAPETENAEFGAIEFSEASEEEAADASWEDDAELGELEAFELEDETLPEPEERGDAAFDPLIDEETEDASLEELEAQIESAVSGLSDDELAEEIDEETLLEIVNEVDAEDGEEGGDELDTLDSAALKEALGEAPEAAPAQAESAEAPEVSAKEGLEVLQSLVKALQNEAVAKSLKGMNISINITFGEQQSE